MFFFSPFSKPVIEAAKFLKILFKKFLKNVQRSLNNLDIQ